MIWRMSAREKELFDALAELMTWLQPWVEDYEPWEPQAKAYDRAKAALRQSAKGRKLS